MEAAGVPSDKTSFLTFENAGQTAGLHSPVTGRISTPHDDCIVWTLPSQDKPATPVKKAHTNATVPDEQHGSRDGSLEFAMVSNSSNTVLNEAHGLEGGTQPCCQRHREQLEEIVGWVEEIMMETTAQARY